MLTAWLDPYMRKSVFNWAGRSKEKTTAFRRLIRDNTKQIRDWWYKTVVLRTCRWWTLVYKHSLPILPQKMLPLPPEISSAKPVGVIRRRRPFLARMMCDLFHTNVKTNVRNIASSWNSRLILHSRGFTHLSLMTSCILLTETFSLNFGRTFPLPPKILGTKPRKNKKKSTVCRL